MSEFLTHCKSVTQLFSIKASHTFRGCQSFIVTRGHEKSMHDVLFGQP